MLELTEVAPQETAVDDEVTLTYERRQKSRVLLNTDSGAKIGVFLPHGQVLRKGMILTGQHHIGCGLLSGKALSVVRTRVCVEIRTGLLSLGQSPYCLSDIT